MPTPSYRIDRLPNVPIDMQWRVSREGDPNQYFGSRHDAEMWAAVQYDGASWPEDT